MELPSKLEEYKGGLAEIVHPGGDIEYGEIVGVSQGKEGISLSLHNRIRRKCKEGTPTWVMVDEPQVIISPSHKDLAIGQGRRFFMSTDRQLQCTLFLPADIPPNFPHEQLPPRTSSAKKA